MKTKLAPKRYPDGIRFEPAIDFGRLYRMVQALVGEKKAGQLAHDLSELDEACESFRRDLKRFCAGVAEVDRDSTALYDAAPAVIGNFHEFRWHMRSAKPVLEKLQTLARNRPPLVNATDDELVERALVPFNRFFPVTTAKKEKSSAKKRGSRPKIVRKSAKRRRKK
jgi:hypothetical protein